MLRDYELLQVTLQVQSKRVRESKRGSGVGLFLDRRIKFENLDVSFTNLAAMTFEFLFVSVECKKLGTRWLELFTDLPTQTSRFLPENKVKSNGHAQQQEYKHFFNGRLQYQHTSSKHQYIRFYQHARFPLPSVSILNYHKWTCKFILHRQYSYQPPAASVHT